MHPRAAAAALAAALALSAQAAENPGSPVLTGSNPAADEEPRSQLLVFRGAMLLNEFVYRAILKLPPDAAANQQTARDVVGQLASFLSDAGYDLATVRAQVKGSQIEVMVDEGALDKIIVAGVGWLGALRFRAKLNLPLDVFNRRLFEAQMPVLARQFGMKGYRFELWPVHLLDADNVQLLEGVEELRAMPMIRPARGYELRIFAQTEAWGTGFSPEIIINGPVGFGLGGRYRWKNIIQVGDRWQWHFRLGGTFRGHLDGSGSSPVNTLDYVSVRWLSKPWDDSPSGLRMTLVPRLEQWTLQRRDLMLESYKLGIMEVVFGFGAQLTRPFSLYINLGMQRQWFYGDTPANEPNVKPPVPVTLPPDVDAVPHVSNRAFLRLNSQYTFNPEELRQDLRDAIGLQLDAYRPTRIDQGFFRFDLQGRWLFFLGWHELRLGAHVTGEAGDIWFVDELPLADHLRVGFGLEKYTHRVGSANLEFRYSLLRDKVKVGVFNDLGVWRHLPRDDPQQKPSLAGSYGASLGLFVFDEIQVDAYYGMGWSTDRYSSTGLSLAIKEAF